MSCRTRSWEEAEKLAQAERDKRDPVKMALKEIAEKEEAKRRKEVEKAITVDDALDEWLAGIKPKSRTRSVQFKSMASKLRSWAAEQGVTMLSDIKPSVLYAWHGTWSPKAQNERDRLATATQNLYVSHIHRFFKWAVDAEYLDRDPSTIVKRQKHEHIQTQPLTPAQFALVLESTYKLDADKKEYVPEYGRDLRAICLLQRWTGIRLIDCLMLRRAQVRDGWLKLTTKKTGAHLERRLPQQVLDALAEIEPQEHTRQGYYFWSAACQDADNLTVIWTQRIKALNKYFELETEDGDPLEFRSHMLRDTFAVELLLAGVPLEKVSKLLTHESIKMTEQYYSPWIRRREDQLQDELGQALASMGATF